ncbi:MAG: hypothetical protein COX65_02990 [Elusimicrobia bacterium CG_4_10_14_0_2_um_filter_56_8]|nr:MAG: hypothetical protein COX65_02990 [Elusimicrobia bacterium CG_4_10_14_0_2_um_filter_56_8]
MEKRKKQGLELSQEQVLRQDLRLFSVLASPEEEFLRQAAELEADPLFVRLCTPGADGSTPVVRKRFAGASYAFTMACGDEAIASAAGSGGGAGEWLAGRPEMLKLAQRAGLDNFEKYFLQEAAFSPAAAGRACGLTTAEAAALKNFTDAFTLAHERIPPAALPEVYLRCAARLSAEEGKLSLAYTHPAYFRGAYSVNNEALLNMRKTGALTREEAARARTLTARAQRIAWRKSGFHRALTSLVEEQTDFLLERAPLRPFTQRELAARIGLNPGTVSRLMAGKTVIAPWGSEIKLKDLFRQKKEYIIDKITEVLGGGAAKMTDREVAESLKAVYGIRISRRSVNLYRTKTGL